ncbi:hypothetical protein FOL47_009014 [Perkinsus chesapeaki]|uniref:Uncharacterized protein n=1 Tax=Perkinsus chesapeaki TaxID=330153 RepID=A0A7J6LB30_PERCH|nr:hypothetical protein FOL47_009014 [Perkinsus chesapeaki]
MSYMSQARSGFSTTQGYDAHKLQGRDDTEGALAKVLALNVDAMQELEEGSLTCAITHLREAEALSATLPDRSSRATTLNNMACYYRKVNKPQIAMKCLVRALRLETASSSSSSDLSAAKTHLNIASVLSCMSKHEQALRHAQGALQLLLALCHSPPDRPPGEPVDADACVTTAGAFLSVGAELEHLGRLRQAAGNYRRGIEFATTYLSPDAPVRAALAEALESLLPRRTTQNSMQNSTVPVGCVAGTSSRTRTRENVSVGSSSIRPGDTSPGMSVRSLSCAPAETADLPPFVWDAASAVALPKLVEDEPLPPFLLVDTVYGPHELHVAGERASRASSLVLTDEDILQAVINIQRSFREYSTLKRQENNAARVIQQRKIQGRWRAKQDHRQQTQASIKVQAVWRGMKARGDALNIRREIAGQHRRIAHENCDAYQADAAPSNVPSSAGAAHVLDASPKAAAGTIGVGDHFLEEHSHDCEPCIHSTVLLPLDESLDDGELFFPRDVRDNDYYSMEQFEVSLDEPS